MNRARNVIPYGRHSIDQDDIDAVVDVLSNRFLTQGDVVPAFESALAGYCQARYCTAVNSGTSGLHVACLAAGVGSGDLVWTVPNSFVASANCALFCGAEIDFVDIDPLTRNLSIDSLSEKLALAAKHNKLPKALIVVHFAGLSCDMQAIKELTAPYDIILIEDAAHALGGHYQGHRVGSCYYSDMAVMSFHPVKSITTAEGGAVLTNQAVLQSRLQLFSKHGITRDREMMHQPDEGAWYYEQLELGYNYRLSDLHAALGLSQLNKLDRFIEQRRRLAERYIENLASLPIRLPQEATDAQSAWHLFMIELQGHSRSEVFKLLKALGIGVNVHYIPIHLQPYYQTLGFAPGDFPHAEAFYKNALTIPLFPAMSADEQDTVVQALKEVLA